MAADELGRAVHHELAGSAAAGPANVLSTAIRAPAAVAAVATLACRRRAAAGCLGLQSPTWSATASTGLAASLSLDPPMVPVALDRGSNLLALVRRTGRFGLNVLFGAQPTCR